VLKKPGLPLTAAANPGAAGPGICSRIVHRFARPSALAALSAKRTFCTNLPICKCASASARIGRPLNRRFSTVTLRTSCLRRGPQSRGRQRLPRHGDILEDYVSNRALFLVPVMAVGG